MTGKTGTTSRRGFMRAGLAASVALPAIAAQARAQSGPDPLITEIQDWASFMGDGVDATPYGLPIHFESDVIRRNVEWLTADTISSINFTPSTGWTAPSPPPVAPSSGITPAPSNWPSRITG